jgi:HK97 gp10 family phage protein
MPTFSTTIKGDNSLNLYLKNITKEMKPYIIDGLKESGSLLNEEVKNKFGKYQEGWPKLKRETVLAKYRKRQLHAIKNNNSNFTRRFNGTIGADDPLVLHGTLRDSISYDVNANDLNVVVYSDVPYAAVQEYGYENVPARSFMRLTLWDKEDDITNIISNKIENIIGRG